MTNCWLQVSSGRGPAECCWVVSQTCREILREADKMKIQVNMLDSLPGDKPGTFKSALLSLKGKDVSDFAKQWIGTIQWIGESPFRPDHKRKNWFIGIESYYPPDSGSVSEKDLKYEAMKASGPGGQHVNKSQTAIRVTHLPTGLNTIAQEERSQYMNKKLAIARLFLLIENEEQQERQKEQKERWTQHNELERGNPVRVYEGEGFKQI